MIATLKASPSYSRVVRSAPGFDRCVASTLEESYNKRKGTLAECIPSALAERIPSALAECIPSAFAERIPSGIYHN